MPRFKRSSPPEIAAALQEPVSDEEIIPEAPVAPAYWGRGALLNVRNNGAEYIVTLHPEEYDREHPERAMRFSNPAQCQNFVSHWYMRQSHDPRAW